MLSVCRIHITSNCCRHWLGSRETWRSPQFLWCSLRHVDFVKSKNRPLSSFQCGFGEVHLASFWVVMSKPFFNEFAIMMRMTLKWLESLLVSAGMRLTRFVNKFWTAEFSASSARFGGRMCLPIFGPGSPDSSFVALPRFARKIVFKCFQVSCQLESLSQTGSSLPSAASAAVQHCRYAGRGRDCSVEIIGKIA